VIPKKTTPIWPDTALLGIAKAAGDSQLNSANSFSWGKKNGNI